MSPAINHILSLIEQLPPAEREELLDLLVVAPGPEKEQIGTEWEAELARREADIVAGRVVGRPADEVFARLKARRS